MNIAGLKYLLMALFLLILTNFAWSAELPADLITKHQAIDLTTSLNAGVQFYQNPYAWKDQIIYFRGGYHQNISPTQAIVAILPGNPSTQYAIVAETTRNFAVGIPIVRCAARVIGTTMISQGLFIREVPHVEVLDCLSQDPIYFESRTGGSKKILRPATTEDEYLRRVEDTIDRNWIAPSTAMEQGMAVAKIRIKNNGEVSAITIETSSGDQSFDASARQAIAQSHPFPPFPPTMQKEVIDITYQFIKQ